MTSAQKQARAYVPTLVDFSDRPGFASPLRRGSARIRSPKGRYLAWFVNVLCIFFFLYGALGKGFAYAGISPFFVGEGLVIYGLWTAIRTRKLSYLAQKPIGFLLIVFALWGLVCTLPFLRLYGVDTLRDAVLWGYSLVAWVVAALVLRFEDCIGLVLRRFHRYGGILISLAVISFLATEFIPGSLPHWPGTAVSIPSVKGGDMLVHVAGAMSFLLVGLGIRKAWWVAPALVGFVAGAVGNRGGALACLLAVGLAFLLFPRINRIVPFLASVLLGVVILSALDVQIKLPRNGGREISVSQLKENAGSIFGEESDAANGNLEGTKEWRLEWWNRIIDYTFRGPYFWTGKGYGINLMVSDGIAKSESAFGGLRSPHNSNMTFLARSGVPGAVFWVTLQIMWVVSLFSAYLRAKRQGKILWARIFAWLLAYWVAFLVNASFDVSLEGPVCGIPFWTIFGLGWGACIRFGAEAKRRTRSADTQSDCRPHFGNGHLNVQPSAQNLLTPQ